MTLTVTFTFEEKNQLKKIKNDVSEDDQVKKKAFKYIVADFRDQIQNLMNELNQCNIEFVRCIDNSFRHQAEQRKAQRKLQHAVRLPPV